MNNLLRFPHKAIRAKVIKEYIRGDYDRVVCFSCGNAAKALEDEGLDVLHIGAKGALEPKRWFTQSEIHRFFPGYFDATSGHLPVELMMRIGEAYKKHLGKLDEEVYVPSGSGETLVCLKMAYPDTKFIAVYNLDDATEYSAQCPLNRMVEVMAEKVIMGVE